mmetsp:Transcript_26710/g.80641  ORF Transcript_26710/g.80641 Transcript_26710/m.80641 type:complete len:495 (-) Transcript_26710:243-1727(-)
MRTHPEGSDAWQEPDQGHNTLGKTSQARRFRRVLNLAGNRLTELDDLGSLQSLTELNVRRNQIVKANSLQQLQSLQRVFLSNNRIQSFDAVECIFDIRFLMELSMDGNPIALQEPNAYRRYAVEHVKTLRHLDLKRVTDAERRTVALESHKEDERRRATEKHEMLAIERRKLQVERHEAIRAAERQWMDQKNVSSKGESGRTPTNFPDGIWLRRTCHETPTALVEEKQGSADPLRRKDKHVSGAPTCVLPNDAHSRRFESSGKLSNGSRVVPSIGYYEVEIGGLQRDERVLQLYGEAWECLDSPKIIGTCTALICRFVSIDRVVEKLRPHASKFVKLRKATFGDNGILAFRQILNLASICQAVPLLMELQIESNPVCSLSLVRPLVCSTFLSIQCFNGKTVTKRDQARHSNQMGLFCIRADKKAISQTSVRYDRDSSDTINRVVASATTNALRTEEFRRVLERYWPSAVNLLVDECINQKFLCDSFFAREPIWL